MRGLTASLLIHVGFFGGLVWLSGKSPEAPIDTEVVAVSCANVESSVELEVPVLEPVPAAVDREPFDAIGAYRSMREFNVTLDKPFAPEPPVPPRRTRYDPRERIGPPREAAVTSAVPTHNSAPDYPESARRRGLEGRAVIEVTVSAEGVPTAVRIAESSGHRTLDEAAAEAVWKWRFAPARRGDRPIESTQTIPFRFRLTD
jgi:protein TonB